jgi:hypothetical protein
MKNRVSSVTWNHEMLCSRPRHEDAVYPNWKRDQHVHTVTTQEIIPGKVLSIASRAFFAEKIIAGVDFGFAGAFVCVWLLMLREQATGKRAVWVTDELVSRGETLTKNALAIKAKSIHPSVIYCDVAGRQVNGQTGKGDEAVLRETGFTVKSSYMRIERGVEALRELIDPAEGSPRLFVDPRCTAMIAAFEGYRRARNGTAIKDGVHDHVLDALRYGICGEIGVGSANVQVTLY